MSLPTISGVAKILDDPELRFGASGVAVAKMRLAFNSRKRQDDGTWVNDRTFYVTGVLFKQAAENAAEALTRQTEVAVVGRLCTEEWTDKEGQKRSTPSLLIDSIGPAISNFQTAKVVKMERSGGQSSGGGFADDPWNSAAPANASSGSKASGFTDSEPPF